MTASRGHIPRRYPPVNTDLAGTNMDCRCRDCVRRRADFERDLWWGGSDPEDDPPGPGCAVALLLGLAMWAGLALAVALALGWRP